MGAQNLRTSSEGGGNQGRVLADELDLIGVGGEQGDDVADRGDGGVDAGVVNEGYVHVIGDLRGSGGSGGEHIGNYNAGGVSFGRTRTTSSSGSPSSRGVTATSA